jgi:hypothetical protein
MIDDGWLSFEHTTTTQSLPFPSRSAPLKPLLPFRKPHQSLQLPRPPRPSPSCLDRSRATTTTPPAGQSWRMAAVAAMKALAVAASPVSARQPRRYVAGTHTHSLHIYVLRSAVRFSDYSCTARVRWFIQVALAGGCSRRSTACRCSALGDRGGRRPGGGGRWRWWRRRSGRRSSSSRARTSRRSRTCG